MVKRYYEYLSEKSPNIDLNYLALDWDDNVLHMPTLIHMDKLVDSDNHAKGRWVPEDVSTAKFALVRKDPTYRYRNEDATQTFCEFRDNGPRGMSAFLDDVKLAIKNGDFGPSWDAFIEYLSKGTIFAIITARGHEPESIKEAVEYIIDNILLDDQKQNLYSHCLKFAYLFGSDYDSYERIPRGQLSKTRLIQDYLNVCDFYGVSSEYCKNKFGLGDVSNPEIGKEKALKAFTKRVNDFGEKIGAKSVSLGFSDDDVKTVNHIEKFFKDELSLEFPIKYNIYNTSVRGNKGIRTKINHTSESWGTDSSVVPFSKWNNMTQNLYPSGKDFSKDDFHNQFKNQMGQIKDLTNDIKKKPDEKSKKVRRFRRRKRNQ